MWKVYRHIRLDKQEPFYIGIAKNKYRPTAKSNRNIAWKRIINKTKYQVDILFEDLTWEQAKDKEKEFIKLYGRRDLGLGTLVNMTDGGDGTLGHSVPHNKEWRDKISKSNKGRKKSDEEINNLKTARWGENYDAEYKKPKIYKSRKGRVFSEEHRQKLSQSRLGIKFSEEHRRKLSLAKIKPDELKYKKPIRPPRGHHMKGKVAKNAIEVMCVITGQIYSSLKELQELKGYSSYKKIYSELKKGTLKKI